MVKQNTWLLFTMVKEKKVSMITMLRYTTSQLLLLEEVLRETSERREMADKTCFLMWARQQEAVCLVLHYSYWCMFSTSNSPVGSENNVVCCWVFIRKIGVYMLLTLNLRIHSQKMISAHSTFSSFSPFEFLWWDYLSYSFLTVNLLSIYSNLSNEKMTVCLKASVLSLSWWFYSWKDNKKWNFFRPFTYWKL